MFERLEHFLTFLPPNESRRTCWAVISCSHDVSLPRLEDQVNIVYRRESIGESPATSATIILYFIRFSKTKTLSQIKTAFDDYFYGVPIETMSDCLNYFNYSGSYVVEGPYFSGEGYSAELFHPFINRRDSMRAEAITQIEVLRRLKDEILNTEVSFDDIYLRDPVFANKHIHFINSLFAKKNN